MALDGLLAEEEPLTDFAVDQAVGDQLENLGLAGGRVEARLGPGRLERDHLRDRIPPRGHGLEPGRVLPIPRKDGIPLRSVHGLRIGGPNSTL